MGKVAIVGVEGSGKTVLMAGLCECFKQVPGSDDPYLMSENQAAFKFMETVPHMLRVKHQWPAATGIDNLRAMRWSYRCGDEVLETVEMLDYPGELYRLAFGDAEEVRKEELESKRDEVKKFLDHLIDADTLLVLLNLSHVINLGENHKNLETVWITRGILSYAKKLKNVKNTVLVFTQADRYAAELQAAGGPDALYAQKLTMLKTLFPDQETMAVSAVSSVEKNEQPSTDYSSSGCLDLMRVILADCDANIQTCLKNCEETSRGLLVFQGDIEDLSLLVSPYLKAIEELKHQILPLKKNYLGVLNGHISASQKWLKFLDTIHEMLAPLSAQEKGDPLFWAELSARSFFENPVMMGLRDYYVSEEIRRKEDEEKEKKCLEQRKKIEHTFELAQKEKADKARQELLIICHKYILIPLCIGVIVINLLFAIEVAISLLDIIYLFIVFSLVSLSNWLGARVAKIEKITFTRAIFATFCLQQVMLFIALLDKLHLDLTYTIWYVWLPLLPLLYASIIKLTFKTTWWKVVDVAIWFFGTGIIFFVLAGLCFGITLNH